MCEIVETDLENIIEEAWLYVARHQSFKLLVPNLTSKAISEACEQESSGIRKAAKICLAARRGVTLGLGESASTLEHIASDGRSAGKRSDIFDGR